MAQQKEAWGSRVGLILAMAGNAVGLGNFLRFPVQAIQNGGGAFIIPYIVCFLLMGIPLLWVEWASGRFGGTRGHHSTPFILDSMDKRKFWKYIGVFGIFTNLAVAAYYCYLESWTLSWVWHTVTRSFAGQSQEEVAGFFGNYVGLNSVEPIIFWIICLVLNTWILSKGLSGGVEKVAKIGMPLLILFGVFLAVMAVSLNAGEHGAINGGSVGLNFLWTPDFSTIWSPKVWLAAAGQIFFTLSVGMGSIQCYASYVRKKDDIALNAMSAGWMNEFVEVVLGAAIIIPISVGYLGVDKVIEMTKSGGLGLGFRTLPFLFEQWGTVLAIICGVFWFGLLFFAGITSSLAMGTPWMGFMTDEFGWSRQKGAWSFGAIVLILGLPTVLFFNQGVFDEYDYWAGTVSLVVFALAEIILFAWVFGMKRGMQEINSGGDIQVPKIFGFVIKWITPILLLGVFLGALITPAGNDWAGALQNGWVLDNGSIIKQITNSGLKEQIAAAQTAGDQALVDTLTEKKLYINAARLLLLAVFSGVAYLVYIAYRKRIKEGRFI
ncbi:MAG TPA: sodium-dependent transporter [Chitinophagales bacterium]|nr:sodium-dependent transporter [Chitinophagales bacterium]HRG85538.1 sodium-dependent transporter [Chitinophagales bacterium]HRH52129.1 sodium-dependent transporter [Chitinophagales bacterium]